MINYWITQIDYYKNNYKNGKPFEHTHHSYIYFPQSSEAAVWFKEHHFSNIQLLIKGSRSMKMEKVLD